MIFGDYNIPTSLFHCVNTYLLLEVYVFNSRTFIIFDDYNMPTSLFHCVDTYLLNIAAI